MGSEREDETGRSRLSNRVHGMRPQFIGRPSEVPTGHRIKERKEPKMKNGAERAEKGMIGTLYRSTKGENGTPLNGEQRPGQSPANKKRR